MLDNQTFAYVLQRLKREPDSPAGRSLKAVFMGGKPPVAAARETGIPMVRFSPVWEDANRIVKALTLTEADGFTPDELPLANRALVAARVKEMAYVPSLPEYVALDVLYNRGGSALKAVNGTTDDMPTVALSALWSLEGHGAVTAEPVGGAVFRWGLTDVGCKLRDGRFK